MKKVSTSFHRISPPAGTGLRLQRGGSLPEITLAYETYGRLNRERDNAILVFHALSGSQHAAGDNPSVPGLKVQWTKFCRKGWWDGFIGPGRGLNTDRYFIICANMPGGCYGSTGPASPAPDGRPFGSRFPALGANDIVDSQLNLLDTLNIQRLHAVIGPSLGGMLALNMAARYPERLGTTILLGSGLGVTSLQRIHNLEQILAIENDPDFNGGDYYEGRRPDRGLALARMISHKTYISLETMDQRARKEVGKRKILYAGPYHIAHPLESYLLHQGETFVRRFDANSYLRIMDMWQNFDLLRDADAADYVQLLTRCRNQRFLIFSIDSDVCFYPDEQVEVTRVLNAAGVACQHITVHSRNGHDAFLLEPELFAPHLDYTLGHRW